jgi:hypothetical protein
MSNQPPPEFMAHAEQLQSYVSMGLSESDTRAYLIDPVLRLLGYSSVVNIRREVPVPATKEFLDYELYADGKAQAIVEAKALRHSVSDQAAAQCVQYAAVLGVRWCIITNGLTWAVYNAHATGPLHEKRVAAVHVDGDERALKEAWQVLSLFARDSLAQSNPLTLLLAERAILDELARPDSQAVAALRRAVQMRFGERVSGQVVVAAIEKLRGMADTDERSSVDPEPEGPTASAGESGPTTRVRRPRAALGPAGVGQVSTLDLIEAGLLPDNAPIESTSRGVSHLARVRGDQIEMAGQFYSSLSAAAKVARGGATNGWEFWSYQGMPLGQLRARLLAKRDAATTGR